jgi:hypothetical protein
LDLRIIGVMWVGSCFGMLMAFWLVNKEESRGVTGKLCGCRSRRCCL